MKRVLVLILIGLITVQSEATRHKDLTKNVKVSVAMYRYDRRCAVSLTFDDGIQEDYTLIAPHLDRYGLKGTFCINGAFIGDLDDHYAPRLTWEQCRELDRHGHEIASHSWSHINEYDCTAEVARQEIAKNDSAIQKELGKRPLTYFFPFNAYTSDALTAAMENRVACRLFQYPLGQRNNKVDWTKMTTWLQEQIDGRRWGVTMTHGIYTAWDQWEEPWLLWDFFRLLSEKADAVWTATFADVAAYITERDSVRLAIKWKNDKMYVTPKIDLVPTLFQVPLTLNISHPSTLQLMMVCQDGKVLSVIHSGLRNYVEFNPYGGDIEITIYNKNNHIAQ